MKNLHSYKEHDRLCQAIGSAKAKVITYGMVASNHFAFASDLLNSDNVSANFDSDPAKWNATLSLAGGGGAIPTLPLDRLEEEYKKADALVVMTGRLDEVGLYLDSKNLRYYFGEIIRDLPSNNILANIIAERDKIADHQEEIARVKTLLSDRKSLEIYETLLKARASESLRERFSAARSVYESDQYFPKDIKAFYPSENEILIDGGAYNGDTAQAFIKWTNGNFKHIYCFEPTAASFNELRENLKAYPYTAYQKGLSDDNKALSFFVYDSSPTSTSTSQSSVPFVFGLEKVGAKRTVTIDVCAIDKTIDDQATFIKMDIEGSELDALKGGAKTIQKYNPKLAICIYHKIEDFWEIPLYIHSLVPEYQFYIRHHTLTTKFYETVLYAVCGKSD
ncbi:MAG: FkbM family methyltransferase [Helicobacteraceae bacterium]|nr:FkbM family methyltransferase [Helicobacteraceae bacterium]